MSKPRFWFNVYRDNSGEYRWQLKAINGRIIAESGEGFNDRGNAIDSIQLVMSAVGSKHTIVTDNDTENPRNNDVIPTPSRIKPERENPDPEGSDEGATETSRRPIRRPTPRHSR